MLLKPATPVSLAEKHFHDTARVSLNEVNLTYVKLGIMSDHESKQQEYMLLFNRTINIFNNKTKPTSVRQLSRS